MDYGEQALVEQALEELKLMGLLRWTGEYRNGQPVYAATEKLFHKLANNKFNVCE